MTREYRPSRQRRTVTHRVPRVQPNRDPSIHALGFTCYRLVWVSDPAPGEADYTPIELMETTSAMGVFAAGR